MPTVVRRQKAERNNIPRSNCSRAANVDNQCEAIYVRRWGRAIEFRRPDAADGLGGMGLELAGHMAAAIGICQRHAQFASHILSCMYFQVTVWRY